MLNPKDIAGERRRRISVVLPSWLPGLFLPRPDARALIHWLWFLAGTLRTRRLLITGTCRDRKTAGRRSSLGSTVPAWLLEWPLAKGCVAAGVVCLLVGWLLNVPATCKCISGTDLLRQFYVLPHWDRSCRSNVLPHPVTVYWHRTDQSQGWPYNARRLVG